MKRKYGTILVLLGLCGCERLSTVGSTPQLAPIQNPTFLSGYSPVSMPMPLPTRYEQGKNSLWQTGSKGFFKDQRARHVGDLITVNVDMDNKESTSFTPTVSKSSSLSTTVGNFMGLQNNVANAFPKALGAAAGSSNKWLDTKSSPSNSGTGKYDLQDKLKFDVAATIIQILPNGNMVLFAKTEIKLMNELREIELRGIIRPSDIQSNNTIPVDKIAELRIVYAGRGDISALANKPWGHQVVDAVSPF
ncbi:MAG: Flagellar L-ring protein [Holosporales bacterium]